ncbi:MAG: asparagine synthase (glutamine-hydrolyzing) [Rhodopirellula sp.]|nr:asparagine synthase (glutamine-hydrolyzing) [Rhodopirellula sp.]
MCGIAGFFCKNAPSDDAIYATLSLMNNRGPDYQSFKSFLFGDCKIALLHSRLSIIDLESRSNQPFTNGRYTIVFNGEIYNYLELRAKLLDEGVKLTTKSDTEVLLNYYKLYGKECVKHFEGMWAFAIYDSTEKTLFLSRDRFAEKPLYYVNNDNGFYFGSEIKFLKSLGYKTEVNHRHLMRHLVHGYKSLYKNEETYFQGVHQLGYAQSMLVSPAGINSPERYWSPKSEINQSMSLEEAIEGTREHLLESVRIRLRSDVPLAFCLSGGVDSASLVSIARKEFNAKLETFSIIDSDERYNEEDNIMATVRDVDCPYNLLDIPKIEALPRLEKLISYHDAPIATITFYVHSLISEAISRSGYRVTFSGTSADELYTGYYDHFLLHLNEVKDRNDFQKYLIDWKNHIGKFIRNPVLKNPKLYIDNPDYREHIFDGSSEIAQYMVKDFNEAFNEEEYTNNILRNRMMNELFHEATPVILHEDDLNSMCYSIENRSPFLDSKLFNFAYSIPSQHLIRDGYGKYVLRESMKGILNDQVRLDRRKKGFNASINSMIDLQDSDVRSYLLDTKAEIFQIINRDKIEKLFNRFPIENHMSKFIFNFINMRIFLEKN